MSFGGTRRSGALRPFDEVCACDHRDGQLVCLCTRTKEQAKERCSRCQDGHHEMQRRPARRSLGEGGRRETKGARHG